MSHEAVSVTRSVTLPASARTVWEEISSPSGLSALLGMDVSVDLRPGGIGRAGSRSMLVTAVEEDRRLAWLWSTDDDMSSVDVALDASESSDGLSEATVLTVVERSFVAVPAGGGGAPQASARAMAFA